MLKNPDLKKLRILLTKQWARAFLGTSLLLAFLYANTSSVDGKDFLQQVWITFAITMCTGALANWRLIAQFEREHRGLQT